MASVLGIDVGGTGIKAALVDTDTGALRSERQRVPTPQPANPDILALAVKRLIDRFDYAGKVGCSFPSVVIDGCAKTAGNLDASWRNTSISDTFAEATGLPFVALNDADAAGIAEMRIGAGANLSGKVITITIGTGLGSGLFYHGQLIPNMELGRMPGKDGQPIEIYASNRARKENNLGWEEWGQRFDYFLHRVARVCSPDHFILSGGVSKKFHKFSDAITISTPIHLARYLNNAGIIGAALCAFSDE